MACGPFANIRSRRGNQCGRCCNVFFRMLKRNLLLVLMVTGAVAGFAIGVIINDPVNRITEPEKKATVIMLVNFPGELFLNMLKMIILPLVIASVITAVSTLNPDVAGRIGRRTMIYYISTMVLASILGLTLVMAIRPGLRDDHDAQNDNQRRVTYRNLDSLLDMIRTCFPSNLVEAAITQKKTNYISVPASYKTYNVTGESIHLEPNEQITAVHSNGTINITTIKKQVHAGSDTVPAGVTSSGGMNILGWTVFSIVFGIVLARLREKGKPLVEFFSTLNAAIMMIVVVVMWIAPVAVCSLVAARIAAMDDVQGALGKLALYIATELCALLIHALVLLPLIFFIITRKNPYRFMKGMGDALITAFGIASSAATLPTTIRCAEQNNHIDPRISRFMLPLGATINMDGLAIARVVSTIFIAQFNNIPLSPGRVVIICLMAVAVSFGAAGIPDSGVMQVILLQSVDLPLHDVGLIFAVEWFIDRSLTTVNVLGDAMGTGIVQHLSRDDLQSDSNDNDAVALNELPNEVNDALMPHPSDM